jgi:hypothetical protein
MPPTRFVDHPGRRIAISVAIAVAAHVAIGAGAWWLFKDYVTPGLSANGHRRIDASDIRQAVAETPIIEGFGITGGGDAPAVADDDIRSPAWDDTRAVSSLEASLPFSTVDWLFDRTFVAGAGPAPSSRHESPNRIP